MERAVVLGTVVEPADRTTSTPGVVDVFWDRSNDGQAKTHNCGKDGRVEIECNSESVASGGYYYPEHLLALDEANLSSFCIHGSREEDDDEDEDEECSGIISSASVGRRLLG